MKKFVKSYYTFIVGMLFFFVIGALFSCVMINEELMTEPFFFGVLIILIILAVIGTWVEIVGFIIHAANNKSLNNKGLWCFMIYLFNFFLVPYYNLKYVIKEEKINSKMTIYGFLLVVSIVVGVLFTYIQVPKESVLYLTSSDENVQITLKGNYYKKDVGTYDLYAADDYRDLIFGVFIYDKNEDNASIKSIHEYTTNWLIGARKNVKLLDSYEDEFDNLNIITKDYYGELKGEKFVYSISTIDVDDSKEVISVLQVVFENDYDRYKSVLKENIRGISVK